MMSDLLPELVDRMRASQRPEQLKLLAAAINEMTILGRSYYDHEDSAGHLRQTNEAIHRLTGRLYDLLDPDEAFTESRAVAVGYFLALLGPFSIARIHGLKA
ncbi:hypothetical protein RAD16_19705 [Bradyrhizobium sp. 18BD]